MPNESPDPKFATVGAVYDRLYSQSIFFRWAKPAHIPVGVFSQLFKRRQLAGSIIGGIRETQEVLDFCADHGITADIELIRIQQINEAYERLLKGDVKYRFVIDTASLAVQ